jgi:diaminohydroxyphosphoribosylaminopyrimidine deaminase / 5-amino-6-(5-phosphoribosylamino)uracil reductase
MPHPPQSEQDQIFMQRALQLVTETIGLASPNPQVGCVLVKQNQIIAEGAHLYDHRDHAEIVALKQAARRGIDVTGATAYVTLEPCSHHGRTAPCADALIESGIARCVIATEDPNPLVSGQGILRLRDAGIEVTIGTLQQQARDLNDAFANFIQHHRPFVTLKAALSADGKLAPPPSQRTATEPHWLTSPEARQQVQLLRHSSDAILTGIGTVLADNPALTDRTSLPRRRPLLRVILDTHLRIPLDSQLVRSAAIARSGQTPLASASDLLIFCGSAASNSRASALGSLGIEVDQIPDYAGRLSLPAVLSALAERDILSVLLECGSKLNGAFLTHNLVDKAILFYGQSKLGDEAIPFAEGIPSPFTFEQTLHRITHSFGPEPCLTGYLHDPWPSTRSPEDTAPSG